MANHPNREKNWPEYLRAFRDKHGLSQMELADKLPASKRAVEDWEQGINTPPAFLKRALRDLVKE